MDLIQAAHARRLDLVNGFELRQALGQGLADSGFLRASSRSQTDQGDSAGEAYKSVQKHGSVFNIKIQERPMAWRVIQCFRPALRSKPRKPQLRAWATKVFGWSNKRCSASVVLPTKANAVLRSRS